MLKKIIDFIKPKEIVINKEEMELITITGDNTPIKNKIDRFINELEQEIFFEAKSSNKFITVTIPPGLDVYHEEIRGHFSSKGFTIEELENKKDNIFLVFWV